MTFLVPALLLALPLAALPVIIHLIHLYRRRQVKWAAILPRAQAATKSMRTFRPTALAARVSVESVTDLHSGLSSRSSAAREVPMAPASADLFWPFFSMMSASCSATTRFKAASSTSCWIPSSFRKSPRLLPRCGFFFLAVLDVGMFAFQGQRPVLRGCFLRFLDEAVQQDDLLVMHKKERSGDACRQPTAHLPEAVAKAVHERHAQRPAILKHLQIFADQPALVGVQLLQPLPHRLIPAGSAEEDHRQRTFSSHKANGINCDTSSKDNLIRTTGIDYHRVKLSEIYDDVLAKFLLSRVQKKGGR